MKNSLLIQLVAVLCIALSSCSAPSYLGKSYGATQNVDVYMDPADVKKAYTTMGTSTYDQDFQSLDAMQQKLVETGKTKGADGVIMKLSEEVAFTQQSGNVNVNANKKTKKDNISTSSTTVDIMKKKITATFIKYD
jgi:hypothetical protein